MAEQIIQDGFNNVFCLNNITYYKNKNIRASSVYFSHCYYKVILQTYYYILFRKCNIVLVQTYNNVNTPLRLVVVCCTVLEVDWSVQVMSLTYDL